jgi:hypothetical protein
LVAWGLKAFQGWMFAAHRAATDMAFAMWVVDTVLLATCNLHPQVGTLHCMSQQMHGSPAGCTCTVVNAFSAIMGQEPYLGAGKQHRWLRLLCRTGNLVPDSLACCAVCVRCRARLSCLHFCSAVALCTLWSTKERPPTHPLRCCCAACRTACVPSFFCLCSGVPPGVWPGLVVM